MKQKAARWGRISMVESGRSMVQKAGLRKRNQMVGKWGEDCAAAFLTGQGYELIERNVRTPEGEIDLVVCKNKTLTFVEVKTRRNNRSGFPEEAITEEKLEHMENSAEHYLQAHPDYGTNWQIGVIAVTGSLNSQNPMIEWFEDVA